MSKVVATMKTGGLATLHEKYGTTVEEVKKHIANPTSLTGSAVQWLDTDDGGCVRADQIERLH